MLTFWALVIIVSYTLTVTLLSSIAVGWGFRSPGLAALAGGPAAVIALYASVFAIGLIFTDPDEYDPVSWGLLAALLIYPATPAFFVGIVAAGAISFIRILYADKGKHRGEGEGSPFLAPVPLERGKRAERP